MTLDQFKEQLQNVDSEAHAALLRYVKGLFETSRGQMSKYYDTWDAHDEVFRSRRPLDKADVEAKVKGKPAKMIVPLTFSQIMTFVAFSIMSITQNRRFFELEPTGSEDNVLTEPLELILERDLRRNQWMTFLTQFFLNVGRFSLGVGEVCYEECYRYMRISKTEQVEGAFGQVEEKTTNNFEKLPYFLGNKVYSVSPYRFFPDVSLPLERYQEGEYCGSEDMFSYSSLYDGLNFNLDKIRKYSEDGYKNRREISRVDLGMVGTPRENPNLGNPMTGSDDPFHSEENVVKGPVVISKMVFQINPSKFKFGGKDETMGEEDFPVRFICWVANDSTVVRFMEASYLHGMYPYFLGQYLPDQHELVSQSLADTCEQITNLVTWKLNAHVTSIRSSLQGKSVIDPAGVDTRTLDSDSPYIYLKKNASLQGVDRYVKQLNTVDTTQNVMKDVGDLDGLLEKITGWSAQMQGQYSQGRRSATQDRVVAQGAGARGKTVLGAIWDTAFEPLGRQLLINNRQDMEYDTFVRIVGQRTWPTNTNTGVPYTVDEVFAIFKADALTLATAEDFFVFDGTLPSEKAFLAQSLQEIFMTILSNPQVALVLGFDPATIKELFNQIYLLRGVTPARLPTPSPQATAQLAAQLQVANTPPSGTSGTA